VRREAGRIPRRIPRSGLGNIGAHMEADVNVIVDVEAGEAKLLIGLIETLVDEWYVARHRFFFFWPASR
jgi:hypothetical protein